MRYGLVLEGGGAKGSYQLGAYMALLEEQTPIEAVVGTSIGALNGAFIVQGSVKELWEIWKNTVFTTGQEFTKAYGQMKQDQLNPIHLVQTLKNMGKVDPDPLRELIHRHIREEKIRSGKMAFGLSVYCLTDHKTRLLYTEDIPKGLLAKYLEASCTFPIFPPVSIEGKNYIDGGVGNNLPFEMVLGRGLTPIILRTNPPIPGEVLPKNAVVIGPRKSLGETMVFDPQISVPRIHLGYRHAKRVLGGYDGYDYSFFPFSERKAMDILEELFLGMVEKFRYMTDSGGTSPERGIWRDLFPKLAESLELSKEYTYKELLIFLVEYRAKTVGISYDRVYSIEEFIELLKGKGRPLSVTTDLLERVLQLLFYHDRKEVT